MTPGPIRKVQSFLATNASAVVVSGRIAAVLAQGDGGADAGEAGEDLDEATPEDAALVAAGAEDEVRVVEHALVEHEGGDGEDERADVEEAGGERRLPGRVHRRLGGADYGHGGAPSWVGLHHGPCAWALNRL
jgi:hypothetical protein